MQSRYYDPEVGRFINADSYFDNNELLGYNLFVYCSNNPINRTDESGNLSLRIIPIKNKKYQYEVYIHLNEKDINALQLVYIAVDQAMIVYKAIMLQALVNYFSGGLALTVPIDEALISLIIANEELKMILRQALIALYINYCNNGKGATIYFKLQTKIAVIIPVWKSILGIPYIHKWEVKYVPFYMLKSIPKIIWN